MKNTAILLLLLFSAIFGATAQDNDAIKLLDVKTFKDSISKSKVQLVDVRTAKEFDAGTISYAQNIDYFMQDDFKTAVEKLDKNKPVYVFCRSGKRSNNSAHILAKMGFKEIYDLEGGILNYAKNGN